MMRAAPLALATLLAATPAFAADPVTFGGHLKGRGQWVEYPEDSVWRESAGSVGGDAAGSLRLKLGASRGSLALQADYQLIGQYGDSVKTSGDFAGIPLAGASAPDDDHRWWDLTGEIHRGDDSLVVQRLDRLNLTWTGERAVVRFGRQAVSWGNGLIYNPMDFLNPFDPAAVDTEYKVGDDMLYAQYLLDSGDDWQFVNVQRRDENGDVEPEVSSTALKYHGFGAEREFDLLLAQHYDQWLLGAGGLLNVGEAVLRGDLLVAEGEDDWKPSLVLDWTWSWVWGGRNVSAVAEYFYNGFGVRESDYAPERLAAHEDLLRRLQRGELFTIGRHYLAGSLLVELTPLLSVTPNLFCNLGDGSALAQVVVQWDAAQDWQVLGALAVPLGGDGTEYGGLETGVDGLTLEVGPSLFLQAAWYF